MAPERRPLVRVLQLDPLCPVDRLGPWLADEGAALDVLPVHEGAPVGLAGADALVVLGGTMGAYDDDPQLGPARDALRDAVADGLPVLGVCLGAQLLAQACGGRVVPGAAGVEAGVVDVVLRPEAAGDPLLGGLPDLPGPSMHSDAVAELPPGAVWLAQTALYPHQAFRVGPRAWGVQFHPEVSVPVFTGWAAASGPELDRAGRDAAGVVGELRARDDEVAATGRELARRFVQVVARAQASEL